MISREILKEFLKYDPHTGVFTWIKPRQRTTPGSVAGRTQTLGYIQIPVNGRLYVAHHLAFLWMTGGIPAQVDHINGIRSDNRWSNLRVATKVENMWNTRKNRRNKSGIKGVSWRQDQMKWVARVSYKGKRISVGSFPDLIGAELAVRKARVELHGEFANHG